MKYLISSMYLLINALNFTSCSNEEIAQESRLSASNCGIPSGSGAGACNASESGAVRVVTYTYTPDDLKKLGLPIEKELTGNELKKDFISFSIPKGAAWRSVKIDAIFPVTLYDYEGGWKRICINVLGFHCVHKEIARGAGITANLGLSVGGAFKKESVNSTQDRGQLRCPHFFARLASYPNPFGSVPTRSCNRFPKALNEKVKNLEITNEQNKEKYNRLLKISDGNFEITPIVSNITNERIDIKIGFTANGNGYYKISKPLILSLTFSK